LCAHRDSLPDRLVVNGPVPRKAWTLRAPCHGSGVRPVFRACLGPARPAGFERHRGQRTSLRTDSSDLMSYRYIALTNDIADAADSGDCRLADKLRELALERRGHVRRTALFASKETPTLLLPGGAALIGDLYDRDGSPVMDTACFQHFSTQRALRQ